MKIAILSDIHGNYLALEAVIKELKKEGVTKLLILGDCVGYYYHPEKVLNLLDSWDKEMIKGNHEDMLKIAIDYPEQIEVIRKKYGSGIKFAIQKLNKEIIEDLINLPNKKNLEINGIKIKLVHGSPLGENGYIYPDSSKEDLDNCFDSENDFIFLGHTHHPFIYEKNGKFIANPGSIGQPRQGGQISQFGILDTENKKFELKEIDYDASEIIEEVKKEDSDVPYLYQVLTREKKIFKNILVTGCGGDIGQSIGKILKSERICKKIIGCDINKDHAGIFIFDKCEVVPKVGAENYLEEIKKIIKKHKIEVIIPMSEPELRYYNNKNISEIDSVPLIMANSKSMEIGFDKLKTAEFLKERKLPYPKTVIVGEKELEFPCIIKNRFGAGKKGLDIVTEENLEFYKKTKPDFIFQEILKPDNEEYTCGVYRTKKGEVRTIIFKRRLLGGFTNYAEVIDNQEIKEVLEKVANELNLEGSINIQLRLTKKGPVIFEINPRFSSTVLFRHLIGFKDLIWQLKEAKRLELEKYKGLEKGTKIYKGFSEYVLFDNGEVIKT
jgi:carbamoyl-phosphate synthase large subunit